MSAISLTSSEPIRPCWFSTWTPPTEANRNSGLYARRLVTVIRSAARRATVAHPPGNWAAKCGAHRSLHRVNRSVLFVLCGGSSVERPDGWPYCPPFTRATTSRT